MYTVVKDAPSLDEDDFYSQESSILLDNKKAYTFSGGSSKVFKRALHAKSFNFSAFSIIYIFLYLTILHYFQKI